MQPNPELAAEPWYGNGHEPTFEPSVQWDPEPRPTPPPVMPVMPIPLQIEPEPAARAYPAGGAVTGKVKPAVAGADVFISFRSKSGRGWVTKLPRPTSASGTFTLRRKVKPGTIAVAQWLGDADHNGDGSNVVAVKR